MTLNKALICSCDENGKKKNDGVSFYVQFNPNKIHIKEYVGELPDKNALPADNENKQTARRSATNNARGIRSIQKKKHQGLVFSTTLFFNTYQDATRFDDVRDLINPLYGFFNSGGIGDAKQVQYVSFYWGSLQIYGRLSGMDSSYTMFAPNGSPVRAEVNIEIMGDYVREPKKTPSKQPATVALADWPYQDFALALAAFGGLEAAKLAARTAQVTNLRTGT